MTIAKVRQAASVAAALLALGCLAATPHAAPPPGNRLDYSLDPRAQPLLQDLADSGFDEAALATVRVALAQARKLPQLIVTEQQNKEKTLTWDAYRPIHVNPANVAAGLAFMRSQHFWLARAEADYGVPPQVITALLAVETKFGRNTGRFRALDALATLGFEHPTRADFFRGELEQLFVLCRANGFDPLVLHSSYAGALGMAQFMPSSYLRLAVDYDGDGRVDLWSPADAIGSIANYLVHYRPEAAWRRGEPIAVAATLAGALPEQFPRNGKRADQTAAALAEAGIAAGLPLPPGYPAGLVELPRDSGAEYWLGLPNFYSVMSYNPRVLYAASVAALADALVQTAQTAHGQAVSGVAGPAAP